MLPPHSSITRGMGPSTRASATLMPSPVRPAAIAAPHSFGSSPGGNPTGPIRVESVRLSICDSNQATVSRGPKRVNGPRRPTRRRPLFS